MRVANTDRRFPKILADELHVALALTRPLGEDKCMELLAIYRRNMIKGVTNQIADQLGGKVEGFEPFPMEWFDKIKALDEAYRRLHRYKAGGAADYISKDVAAAVSKIRASMPRRGSRKVDHEEVATYLKKRDYANSDNQKGIIGDAESKFEVSERTVRTIAAEFGLTRK